MMEPEIRFCTSADGTRIAYTSLGQGFPLLNIPGWAENIQIDLERAQANAEFQAMIRGRRAATYDRRGVGSSQREVDDLSLECHLADVAAVADQLQFDTFDAIGWGEGAPIAAAYAAQHPERIRRLVLWTPFPRGDATVRPEASQAFVQLMRDNWPLASRALADIVFPHGPDEARRWFTGLLRESISPDVVAGYAELQATIDVRSFLPRVEAPTLVLHRRGDRVVPFEAGRAAAAMIPDARFVALEGDIFHPFFGDTSYMRTIENFLSEGIQDTTPESGPAPSGLVTILFTDLVGHTEMMSRLGDAKGREVLREHERIMREVLAEHGGTEVKTMGDGFLASFGSVARAVECAIALQRRFAEWNADAGAHRDAPLQVRCGLNAGEPIEEEGDLFGATVILAARIAAKAEGGEIMASDVVRGLCSGKGFLFADRGEFAAKGFEEPVRLFEVRWRDA